MEAGYTHNSRMEITAWRRKVARWKRLSDFFKLSLGNVCKCMKSQLTGVMIDVPKFLMKKSRAMGYFPVVLLILYSLVFFPSIYKA